MDDVTRAVRDQYEQFPYPAGAPTLRVTSDARLLLSLGDQSRGGQGPIRALDAGCGRGVGLLGCATLQPDVEFLGIDINRKGLQEVGEQIEARGLSNVRVQEVDLMTLEGLEVPDGGFDVIYSSGVLHHLSDPAGGLRGLRSVLAPHGVISLMVYGLHGRQPLYRLIRAAELLVPGDRPLGERIAPARALAEFCGDEILGGTPWDFVPHANDTEFVDLCLNPNETSYSVEGMWELLAGAGLKFLRWSVPDQWSAELLPEGELRRRAAALSELDLYRLIEQVSWRESLELVVGHADNAPRPALDPAETDATVFAVNPEISFAVETRTVREGKRIESISYRRYGDEETFKGDSAARARALTVLWDQSLPFTGDSFVEILGQEGVGPEEARGILRDFTRKEILYRPHRCDV